MTDEWKKRRKVAPLFERPSPNSLAATMVDKTQQGKVANLVQIVQWYDETVSTAWTDMPLSTLILLSRCLELEINRVLQGMFNE